MDGNKKFVKSSQLGVEAAEFVPSGAQASTSQLRVEAAEFVPSSAQPSSLATRYPQQQIFQSSSAEMSSYASTRTQTSELASRCPQPLVLQSTSADVPPYASTSAQLRTSTRPQIPSGWIPPTELILIYQYDKLTRNVISNWVPASISISKNEEKICEITIDLHLSSQTKIRLDRSDRLLNQTQQTFRGKVTQTHLIEQVKNITTGYSNSPRLSRRLKLNIFRTNVKSVLLYGCETWKVTKSLTNRLQVFINTCLRKICGIYYPKVISNSDLHQMTGHQVIAMEIGRRKWGWIGHTLRKHETGIARQALFWNVKGKRSIGRRKITWRTAVEKEAEQQQKKLAEVAVIARNKNMFNRFVNALRFTVDQ